MKRDAAGVLLVAVYVRVSKKDQHLTQQFRGMREEAERRGWRVVAVYRERKSSRKERPALAAMLAAAERREFGAVMVWRLDRLGRSLIELVSNVERLNARGVAAVSVKDGALDTASASARFTLTILGAVAEYERELIRERTAEGLERVRARGSASGKPIGRPRANAAALNAAAAECRFWDGRWMARGPVNLALPDVAAAYKVSESTLRRHLRKLQDAVKKGA